MPALSGRRMFSVGATTYVWEDVVLAAILWGDWAGLEHDVRDGLACLHRLEDIEDEDEALLEEEVTTAAAEFRYARDLVAAEDTQAWLEQRGLTAEEWMDFIQRSVLRRKWAEDLETIRQEYPVDEDEVDEVILCEAICGGHVGVWTSRLAARAAVHASSVEENAGAGDGISEDEVRSVLDALPAEGQEPGLPDFARPADPGKLAALARLEAAWRRFAARQVTPAAIREQLLDHRLDWTRLHVQAIRLSNPDAAHEAALCVREDGRDPAEVAAEAGAEFSEGDWYLDEADPGLRDHLLGAQGGEVLGPLPTKDGFLVLSILAKQPPAENDPALLARAERALLDRATRREVENRVKWSEPL